MAAPEIVFGDDGIPVSSRSMLESNCDYRMVELYPLAGRKPKIDDSDFSRRGSAYHAVKKFYVRMLSDAQTPMDKDLADEAFQRGIAETKTPSKLIPEVRDLWDRHVEHFELNLNAYIQTEQRRVRPEAAVPYIYEPDLEYAHADRDELETIDDKTYFRSFTEAHAKSLWQTRMYVWCAMQEHPNFATYRMTYNMVRLNQFVSVVFSKDDFDVLDREVRARENARREVYRSMQADPAFVPQAQPGAQCCFCYLHCPLFDDPKTAMGYVRVNSGETFEEWGKVLIATEKRVSIIKDSLKSYVTMNGAQSVNGETFQFKETASKSYPASTIVDRLRSLGVDPVFSVTKSALKKLFKLKAGLEEQLESVASVKTSARFGHSSAKEDVTQSDEDE
jgi:hypothetical protein